MRNNSTPARKALLSLIYLHPVLIRGLAFVPTVLESVSLKNAVSMCMLMLAPMLCSCAVSSLLGKRLPNFLRPAVPVILSAALLVLITLGANRFFPSQLSTLGASVSLLAVSSLILTYSKESFEIPLLQSVLNAGAAYIGWASVTIIVGFFREIFYTNTIWGKPVKVPLQLDSMGLPFTALIIIAFAAAFYSFILVKLRPALGQNEEAPEPDANTKL